jgi:hypothetical protein
VKPTTEQHRPKEWIPFTNYALVATIPTSIRLQEHLFPYEGAVQDPGFIWGLHGTLSANAGLFLADAFASKKRLQLMTVQTWYRVENLNLVRSQIDRQIAEKSGFMHLDRLKTNFREELRDLLLEEIREKQGERTMAAMQEKALVDIVLRDPSHVHTIAREYRKVNVIVHPVRQLFDKDEARPLHVATVRLIKARIMASEVRYMEHIKVTY